MSSQPLIDTVHMKPYTQEKEAESEDVSSVHIDVDEMPHVMGLRPAPPRQELNLPTIEALESFKKHRMCSTSNILWSIFIGWWVSIAFVIVGILFFLTGFFYKHGIFCFRAAYFIIFPFGKIAHTKTTSRCHFLAKGLWILFLPIYGIISLLGAVLSWEFVYYIPMAKTLWKLITVCVKENPANIEFTYATDKKASIPLILCSQSGSWYYFKFTVYGFEVIYLNFIPFVFLSLLVGFINFGHTGLGDPILGSVFALFGAMPAAYFIGVCVDDLSKTLGIIIGSILCSVFLALIELILYYFSLRTGMVDITRAAITGAFLMNLLIIPGVAMLAAGIKWKETVLNRKAQSIGGYFLLLAIISMLFPSVFYHIHGGSSYKCDQCTLNGTAPNQTFNCDYCTNKEITNIVDDPVYKKFGAPLQYTMSILMPAIYIISFMFSVRTHAHIYVVEHDGEHEKGMSTAVAIIILCISTVTFSLMAHVMTDKMPEALEKLHLSERFVGLIFYTLIPNAAEYINAIKFALNGNIGLSMEIGNQGAILTSLVEMPALMLISLILYKTKQTKVMFTLIFPLIDIFSIVTAVFLRNAILMEKKINYSTGLSFLIIFTLISVVYYFENF